jgi:hypothetical protein
MSYCHTYNETLNQAKILIKLQNNIQTSLCHQYFSTDCEDNPKLTKE